MSCRSRPGAPTGSLRSWTPIWVVRVGAQVYVRTWHRRDTGWFGRAVAARQARIHVPDLEADVAVAVEDIGERPAALRHDIDAAYLSKYGRAGTERMVSDSAAAATLRLDPYPASGRAEQP